MKYSYQRNSIAININIYNTIKTTCSCGQTDIGCKGNWPPVVVPQNVSLCKVYLKIGREIHEPPRGYVEAPLSLDQFWVNIYYIVLIITSGKNRRATKPSRYALSRTKISVQPIFTLTTTTKCRMKSISISNHIRNNERASTRTNRLQRNDLCKSRSICNNYTNRSSNNLLCGIELRSPFKKTLKNSAMRLYNE